MDYVQKVFKEVTDANKKLYDYASSKNPQDSELNTLILTAEQATYRLMMSLKPFIEYQAPLDIEKLDSKQLELFYN